MQALALAAPGRRSLLCAGPLGPLGPGTFPAGAAMPFLVDEAAGGPGA